MFTIKQQIVSQEVISKRSYGYGNPCNYITIHETDNWNKGANAQSHANLQSRLNPRQASWHYQVDDQEIIQSFPDTVMCWAAGDGNGPGNSQSIHIEICVNSDGDFRKAVQNAAALTKVLMDRHNIPVSNVVQHNRWNGKNCPRQLRADSRGVSWSDFKNMINVKGKVPASKTKVGSVKVKAPKKSSGGYTGNSIIDYLKSIGQDSSFANRSKLARQHGIKNYKGTAAQNLELLKKLRAGGTASTKKPAANKKGSQDTNSIVDYLNSIGVDSSFANRAKLAKKHGIQNYRGTASQNIQLLNKLRSGKSATRPARRPAAAKRKQQAKGTVHLPASAETWRTYKLNVEPVKENSDWSLTPSRYGGLTYEILGRPYPNVVTINTSRGKRNIYVGPETGAVLN